MFVLKAYGWAFNHEYVSAWIGHDAVLSTSTIYSVPYVHLCTSLPIFSNDLLIHPATCYNDENYCIVTFVLLYLHLYTKLVLGNFVTRLLIFRFAAVTQRTSTRRTWTPSMTNTTKRPSNFLSTHGRWAAMNSVDNFWTGYMRSSWYVSVWFFFFGGGGRSCWLVVRRVIYVVFVCTNALYIHISG